MIHGQRAARLCHPPRRAARQGPSAAPACRKRRCRATPAQRSIGLGCWPTEVGGLEGWLRAAWPSHGVQMSHNSAQCVLGRVVLWAELCFGQSCVLGRVVAAGGAAISPWPLAELTSSESRKMLSGRSRGNHVEGLCQLASGVECQGFSRAGIHRFSRLPACSCLAAFAGVCGESTLPCWRNRPTCISQLCCAYLARPAAAVSNRALCAFNFRPYSR
jgi:hypothetical protein